MNLTEKPEVVTWPETHFVFIEKIGPFQETAAQAWEELHKMTAELSKHNKISGYMALYKFEPQLTYRAGVAIDAKPSDLPPGLKSEEFHGGKYSKFVLTGPYSDLPEACGKVFHIVEGGEVAMRKDYCIENYVNDPAVTKPEELITEILIPTA